MTCLGATWTMTSTREPVDAAIEEFVQSLNFRSFREGNGVFDVDA
jgi:hypothetical protein